LWIFFFQNRSSEGLGDIERREIKKYQEWVDQFGTEGADEAVRDNKDNSLARKNSVACNTLPE